MIVAPIPTAELSDSPIVKDGKIVKRGRFKDPISVASRYQEMWESDYSANYNRSLVDSMFDGGPPKSESRQIAQGGLQETNINWGDGERLLHEQVAVLDDLIFSPEVIGSTPLKRSYADEETRQDYAEVIAEEISAMIREAPFFVNVKQREHLELKKHGVAAVYWHNENDWRWDMVGLEYFKMPRPTEIGVQNLSYCGIRADMTPEKLYEMILYPDIATLAGWNVPAVKRTLMKAAPINPISDDFEAWERYWKDNDYQMSYQKAVCPLVMMPVKEMDQTVTMLLVNWDGTDEFLYKKEGAFGGMERFCQIYIDNVGTNKYYHAIRGFGHKIYSEVQTVNRMTNQFADAVTTSGLLFFTPPNESDADEGAYMQSSSYAILNPGWIQSNVQMPDLQKNIMPGLSVFTQRLQQIGSRIGSGNSGLSQDGKTSKHMFNAQLEQMAIGSDANMESYLNTWERHYREIVRRIIRKGYLPKEPGGVEIAELRRRIFERGVPTEALEAVDWKRCKINRGVGSGSAAVRILTYDRLQALRGNMAPDTQQLLDRDSTIAIGGVELANRYFPKPKDKRLPPDASYADATNPELMRGEVMPIRDGQNHIVIAKIRMEKLQELNQQIVDGGGDPALMQLVVPMHYLLQDMQGHLDKANPQDPQVKELEDLAGQFNEMVTNGLRKLAAKQAKMQAEMAHNAGKVGDQQMGSPDGQGQPQGQNGSSPQGQNAHPMNKLLEQSIKLKGQIQLNEVKIAGEKQKQSQKAAAAAQDMQLKDIQAASEIRRSRLA